MRKISLAAYAQLYSKAPAQDREFESERIVEMPVYHPEVAGPTRGDRCPEYADPVPDPDRRSEGAEKCLEEIPADSPERGDAEIKTGQAMWNAYLKGMQEVRRWETKEEPVPAGVELAAKKAALDSSRAAPRRSGRRHDPASNRVAGRTT